MPSAFPPGTDPNVVAAYHVVDEDGSGLIDDNELRTALSSFNQTFSLRTVRLLMYLFTRSNARQIGSFPSLDSIHYLEIMLNSLLFSSFKLMFYSTKNMFAQVLQNSHRCTTICSHGR